MEECNCVIVIWNGKSRGTEFTIEFTKEKNKSLKMAQK